MPRPLIKFLLWPLAFLAAATLFFFVATATVFADPVKEAMQDYSEFATYDAGVILPEQVTQDIFESVVFIDTRTAEDFETGTIPGAMHIEWREVFANIDTIPAGRKVILFCNTGVLSAQAVFGLRVLGWENVLVLQTGFDGWSKTATYRPDN